MREGGRGLRLNTPQIVRHTEDRIVDVTTIEDVTTIADLRVTTRTDEEDEDNNDHVEEVDHHRNSSYVVV